MNFTSICLVNMILMLLTTINSICNANANILNEQMFNVDVNEGLSDDKFSILERNLRNLKKIREKNQLEVLIQESAKFFETCPLVFDLKKHLAITKTKPVQQFNSVNAKHHVKCVDPSPAVMMGNLVRLQFIFKDLTGILDIPPVQALFQNYIKNEGIQDTADAITYGSPVCGHSKNFSQIHEMSICPWHTKIEIRENKYPTMIANVKCNCDDCQKLSNPNEDVVYRCQAVDRLSPALVRNEYCDQTTGVFEWVPILERINVACVCGRKDKLYYATT